MTKICIVQSSRDSVSETFIHAHNNRLPGVCCVIHGSKCKTIAVNGKAILAQNQAAKGFRLLKRKALPDSESEDDLAYIRAFQLYRPDVVLAEYGTVGVRVRKACQLCNIPLVVHFHGYDASRKDILRENGEAYRKLFSQAAAIIVVSHAMQEALIAIGCPAEKLIYNVYGVDCALFKPAESKPIEQFVLSVGRLVEKKAPHLTLLAFKTVLDRCPEARLRMIGDGPLMGVCEDLVRSLDMSHAVTFLGPQSHETVRVEMQRARAFVQHSVVAANGDSEGTPVAILEAGAAGLPVIATLHAGIPDVVIHGSTGFLVPERDINAMAEYLIRIVRNSALADEMGRSARNHVSGNFTVEKSLRGLATILEKAARR